MREPVNRTILLLDVERFSHRDDVVQRVLRRSLNLVIDQTLLSVGVEATHQYREDRGDGVIILLSGDVAKTALLRSLLTLTPDLLHEHNRLAAGSAQMRLRMVVAVGEVAHDPYSGTVGGLVGHDLNQACRLLDSDALRAALSERLDEDCVLMVSPAVYEGVVRHGHRGLRPELFERTEVESKNGLLSAWLHCGRRGAVGEAYAPESAGAGAKAPAEARGSATPTPAPAPQGAAGPVMHFHGAPTVHGSIVGGDQHGVSGGRVSGGVVLGGSVASGHGSGSGSREAEDGRQSS